MSSNLSLNEEIEQLMSKHDPILLFASRLLPPAKALDASALYAWCRRLDEITDNPQATSYHQIQKQLEDWQRRFDKIWKGEPVDAMDAALSQCLERNHPNIGKEPFCDMMIGMRADAVVDRRIQSLQELEYYGYQVAGTVGVMLLPLLIDEDTTNDLQEVAAARDPAIALGTAIQLINILRDAAPDAALGRIYLPQDILKAHGVSEADVFALKASDGYCQVVQSVAKRAEELLLEAERGKATLPGLGPLLVQIIIELYRGYLEELETMEYNNLRPGGERVRISTGRKLVASLKAVAVMISGK